MAHASKTLFADRVVFYRKGDPTGYLAFVIAVHSDHCASLLCYCPVSHQWFEVSSVMFGKKDAADYFVNTPDQA